MVFCGSGGMATPCDGVDGAEVAAGGLAGALSWAELSAGALSFFALVLLVVALVGAFFGVACACSRFRQAFFDVVLFIVLQYAAVPGFGLVMGVGVGAASSWAKAGAATASAANAATEASNRRMVFFSWAGS
jgi:hypothetical protein